MTNPKAPRTRRSVSETVEPLGAITRRLRLLGATSEEVAAFVEAWDDFDADWTPERRAEFSRLPDSVLLEGIHAVRAEWREATLSEDEERAITEAVAWERLVEEATVAVQGAPTVVGTWIRGATGDARRARAEAVLAVEQAGRRRPTVLKAAAAILGRP